MKLSILVITHNSQDIIKGCLKSAQLADEIILIDDFSTDDTLKIAEDYQAKTFNHKLTTFSRQRTWAAQKATGDWIMFLDADERISPALFKEIRKAISQDNYTAFRLKRVNYFYGQKINHGGYWPDWQTRLFKRSTFKGVSGASHENFRFQGKLGDLENPLLHFTDRSIKRGLYKTMIWTEKEAQAFFQANHPLITWWRLIKVMVSEFCYRYIKKQGFKDGYVGFVDAVVQAINRFFIYQQIWEIQHQDEIAKKYRQLDKKLS